MTNIAMSARTRGANTEYIAKEHTDMADILEFKFDTQLLIEGHDLDEDEIFDYITEHFYTCTKEILNGLGKMYSAGGEFTENIDRAGGSGTAEFTAKAIEVYCR